MSKAPVMDADILREAWSEFGIEGSNIIQYMGNASDCAIGAERRIHERWHVGEHVPASLQIADHILMGELADLSMAGLSVRLNDPALQRCVMVGTVSEAIIVVRTASGVIDRRVSPVRQQDGTIGLLFDRTLDARMFHRILDDYPAYSVRYKNGKVCFVGELDSRPATAELLKYVAAGTRLDLSKAMYRGDV